MRRFSALSCAAAGVLFAGLMLWPSQPRAGGNESEGMDDHEHGAPFFGEAKDVSTMKPLPGVVVKAKVINGRLGTILINTNIEGRFKLPGFGKTVDPANVEISCAKQGYRTLDVIRRRVASDFDAPVEIECLLDPQN
jgi:hypothetical protein